MCKVSICIPTFNNPDQLSRLLESIYQQNYVDYNVIISDNSDNPLIEQMISRRKDNNLIYLRNEKNIGAVPNWNNALKSATGEYIKIMFSDDWFTGADCLETFVQMLEKDNSVNFAFSGSRQVEKNNNYCRCISNRQVQAIKKDYKKILLGNYIGAPSATIFRNKKNYKFDMNLRWYVDVDFYLQILQYEPHFNYSQEPLVSIGVSDTQLTNQCANNWELQVREYGYLLRKYHLQFNFCYLMRELKFIYKKWKNR